LIACSLFAIREVSVHASYVRCLTLSLSSIEVTDDVSIVEEIGLPVSKLPS
jgi:hypothetical protein